MLWIILQWVRLLSSPYCHYTQKHFNFFQHNHIFALSAAPIQPYCLSICLQNCKTQSQHTTKSYDISCTHHIPSRTLHCNQIERKHKPYRIIYCTKSKNIKLPKNTCSHDICFLAITISLWNILDKPQVKSVQIFFKVCVNRVLWGHPNACQYWRRECEKI